MTLITPEELADLEAKARAAEGWGLHPQIGIFFAGDGPPQQSSERFYDFVSGCGPDVGLRLIATIRALTARAEAAERVIRDIVNEADDRGRQHTAAFMDGDDLDAAKGHACAAAACAHIVEDAARRAARLLPAEPDHGEA